ncbi:MAG: hypothetical protein EBZ50_08420 [Alphaproteobacteria bacterium]|nr:hypothetical protein [Alphaproteobacteria bacterium]
MTDAPFHIVLTLDRIWLFAWPGAEPEDLEAHVEGFVSCLGPFDDEGLLDLLHAEWPDLARLRNAEIASVLNGEIASVAL